MDGGYATLRKHFKQDQIIQVTHHPNPLQVVNYHLVFSINEKNKQLLQLFNKGLKNLRSSGKVDKYLREAWSHHSN